MERPQDDDGKERGMLETVATPQPPGQETEKVQESRVEREQAEPDYRGIVRRKALQYFSVVIANPALLMCDFVAGGLYLGACYVAPQLVIPPTELWKLEWEQATWSSLAGTFTVAVCVLGLIQCTLTCGIMKSVSLKPEMAWILGYERFPWEDERKGKKERAKKAKRDGEHK